jgi:hypothetical protein
MPVVSQAQNRFFHWADAHPEQARAKHGLKQSTVKEFIWNQPLGSVKKLPQRVGPKAPSGSKMMMRKPFGSFAP